MSKLGILTLDMGQPQVVLGIDIGSSKVAAAVGRFAEGGIEVAGMAKVTNHGLRKGQVVDIAETVTAISALLEDIERVTQTPVTHATVGIGGVHVETTSSKGVIAVSRPDGEITPQDVDRVLEAARAVAMPANREIIHVLPKAFTVDAEGGIVDPVGMTGIRLEVDAHVVTCASPAVKNLVRAVTQAGLSVGDLVFAPLATAELILTKRQKESGVALIDIGAGTTSLAVYEEGDLVHAVVLPIGSMHITNDIAIGLRTSIDLAEAIKVKYGTALKDDVRDDTIDLTEIDPNELQRPKARYIAEIIEARLSELFLMVNDELRKIGKDGTLPAGVVFTGGGSRLTGIVELAKNSLHLPAKLGHPALELSGSVDKVDDPSYATAVGLVLWSLSGPPATTAPHQSFSIDGMEGAIGKARDFLRQLLP
ncbi:cell division protein FtsA [Candidatus Berkelbacteria bacterium]|nr:cell division protein FtsA [Candidatus Berkelbacteria bacterium]